MRHPLTYFQFNYTPQSFNKMLRVLVTYQYFVRYNNFYEFLCTFSLLMSLSRPLIYIVINHMYKLQSDKNNRVNIRVKDCIVYFQFEHLMNPNEATKKLFAKSIYYT